MLSYTRPRLTVEEEGRVLDGVFRIATSDRDDADVYDGRPSAETREQFRTYAKELRDLSPLVYVTWEEVDEWINLIITVRSTPRKQRPAEIPKLEEKVIMGLPAEIMRHPVCRGLHVRRARRDRCPHDCPKSDR